MNDHPDHPDHRLSFHWRTTPHRQEMTEQEAILAKWLGDQGIEFAYEQLQLIKNNHLAGQEIVDGKKVRKHDVLRSVPDFIFTDGPEIFLIEVTERKRPDPSRPDRRAVDPKSKVRHLARLAHVDCAVIYRGEMAEFLHLFEKNLTNLNGEKSIIKLKVLHQTISEWLLTEWKEIYGK